MKKKSLSLMLISLLVSAQTLAVPALSVMADITSDSTLPCSCDDERCKDKDKCKDKCKDKKDTKEKKKADDCEKNKKDCNKNDGQEMKFWTDDHIKLLSEDQKKKLCDIQEKLKNGKCLDESDKKVLFELRETVFKCKLGDKKYTDFKKLMEKKKCGEKLTDDEECKLKDYFKELK